MNAFLSGSQRNLLLRGVVFLAFAGVAAGVPRLAAQQAPAAFPKEVTIPEAKVDSNVIYGQYSGLFLLMDVYHPAQGNGRGVVFVHGGHWRHFTPVNTQPWKNMGNVEQLTAFIKPYVDAGYTVFVPDFRMAPRFTYPAQLYDIQRAVRFVRFNAKRFGIDPDHIGGVGFSAGAHLIDLVALMDAKPSDEDTSPVGQVSTSLQAVVSVATPANLGENASVAENSAWTSLFIGDQVMPGLAPNSDVYKRLMAASPITYVRAGAPPFLLVHADKDAEVPIKIEEEFQQALEKAGVTVKMIVVPNSEHEATFSGDHGKVFTPAMVQWMDQYLQTKTSTSSAR